MQGVDPYTCMQQVPGRLDRLVDRSRVETEPDECEQRYGAPEPEIRDLNDGLIARVRRGLPELT